MDFVWSPFVLDGVVVSQNDATRMFDLFRSDQVLVANRAVVEGNERWRLVTQWGDSVESLDRDNNVFEDEDGAIYVRDSSIELNSQSQT